MSPDVLQQLIDAIVQGEYDVTQHAAEEMAEDGLDIYDVESAIINGGLTKAETEDPRGARSTIVGRAIDEKTRVGVVGRFTETGVFLIITVYIVTD